MNVEKTARVPTLAEARKRAERIRTGIVAYAQTRADIIAAYQDRDWSALGYESWDAYLDGEFSDQRLRLSREDRQETVAVFREAGMSTRAIASAVGVNQGTVVRDLASGDADASPPQSGQVAGIDGKSYPASPRARSNPDPEIIDAEIVEDAPVPESVRKQRKPRVDVVRVISGAVVDLRGIRDRLETLTADQIGRQDAQARSTWATGLSEQLEAIRRFRQLLERN